MEGGINQLHAAVPQGCRGESLCRPPREQSRSVCAGQHWRFDLNRPDLKNATAIDSTGFRLDHIPQSSNRQPFDRNLDVLPVKDWILSPLISPFISPLISQQRVEDVLGRFVERGSADLLLPDMQGFVNELGPNLGHSLHHVVGQIVQLLLLLPYLASKCFDRFRDRHDVFVRNGNGLDHLRLRGEVSLTLDHHNRILRSAHDELHLTSVDLIPGGVDDQLSTDLRDSHTGYGLAHRDLRDRHGGRRRNDRKSGRKVNLIVAQDPREELRLLCPSQQ
mmetsp:Transcript_14229/g.34707  ORF Transcript_14229/g.34707 Transcript_14229/m.34707 type:complete len:277 (-) Transcript_14229:328-1158(-)